VFLQGKSDDSDCECRSKYHSCSQTAILNPNTASQLGGANLVPPRSIPKPARGVGDTGFGTVKVCAEAKVLLYESGIPSSTRGRGSVQITRDAGKRRQ
jgi:hypothetical protein